MRIDGASWTGNTDWRAPSQGSPAAGMLAPLSPGHGRKGDAPPSPHTRTDEYFLFRDPVHGAVVIDLYQAATRYEESPNYRLAGDGSIEASRKPLRGGIIDLLA